MMAIDSAITNSDSLLAVRVLLAAKMSPVSCRLRWNVRNISTVFFRGCLEWRAFRPRDK